MLLDVLDHHAVVDRRAFESLLLKVVEQRRSGAAFFKQLLGSLPEDLEFGCPDRGAIFVKDKTRS